MDLARLKHDTALEHEQVERTVPLMGAELTRSEYCAVLMRFYGFVKGWELWSESRVPERLRSMLIERQKSSLLEADLLYFGASLPTRLYAPPTAAPPTEAEFLGAMYVLEGSTLGGQYIARHVEQVLHLTAPLGSTYFRGYGDRTGSMWNAFKALLECVPEQDAASVTSAAKSTFHAFGAWMSERESLEDRASEAEPARELRPAYR